MIACTLVSAVMGSAMVHYPVEKVLNDHVAILRSTGVLFAQTITYLGDFQASVNLADDHTGPFAENGPAINAQLISLLSKDTSLMHRMISLSRSTVDDLELNMGNIIVTSAQVDYLVENCLKCLGALKPLIPPMHEEEDIVLANSRSAVDKFIHSWKLIKVKMGLLDHRYRTEGQLISAAFEAEKLRRLVAQIATAPTTSSTRERKPLTTTTTTEEATTTTRMPSKKRNKRTLVSKQEATTTTTTQYETSTESTARTTTSMTTRTTTSTRTTTTTMTTTTRVTTSTEAATIRMNEDSEDEVGAWTLVDKSSKQSSTHTKKDRSSESKLAPVRGTRTTAMAKKTTAQMTRSVTTVSASTTMVPDTTTVRTTTTTTTVPDTTTVPSTTTTAVTDTTTVRTMTTTTTVADTTTETSPTTTTSAIADTTTLTMGTRGSMLQTGAKLSIEAQPFQPSEMTYMEARPVVEQFVRQLCYMSYGAGAALNDMGRLCQDIAHTSPNEAMAESAFAVAYKIHVIRQYIEDLRLSSHELVHMADLLPSILVPIERTTTTLTTTSV